MGELSATQRQIALLKQPTPGTTPAQTPGSTQTPSSELSGASTQIGAAACFASDYASAQAKAKSLLISPPTRAPTRHMPAEVQQQLADERAGRELARQVARQEAREAEQATWQLLRAPFDSWDDQALWQLAMCEFALEHIADVASSPKQLQLDFRAACEDVRHPDEVPRLRGSKSIDALMDALHDSELLRDEVLHQLARYKRLYCSIFRGFGRFRMVALLPGETLLGLMKRTHDDALKWRPPGKTPAEMLALVSKEKGKYRAKWREDTWLARHVDAGGTLSLRGTVGVTKGGVRRLENLPVGQRPSIEHFTTVRNHDYQAHFIQMRPCFYPWLG